MPTKRENRFEKNPRALLGVLFGLITVALLVGVFFLVKAVRDEARRGVERYIVLRERRPDSDIPQTPSRELVAVADGLERKAYPFRVDADGYLKPSAVHRNPDLTVVFLGGSTTECMYMQEEERFPYLAGRQLEKALGLKVNALNGGTAGNNSLHCVLALQGKVLPIRPRAVVLMECVNDVNHQVRVGSYWSPHPTRGVVFDKEYGLFKTLVLEHMVGRKPQTTRRASEFAGLSRQGPAPSAAELTREYRKILELFVFLCRQHGIAPVFMTQFNRYTDQPAENLLRQMQSLLDDYRISYADYRALYRATLDEMRAVAREQNVALIDLDALVPKTKEHLYDGVHLNARGSALVADLVAARLAEILAGHGPAK